MSEPTPYSILDPLHLIPCPFLGADANDTASRAATGVASLLALDMAAPAEVVDSGVDDDGTADDALGADQLDELVLDGTAGVALRVRVEVAEVANVAVLVARGAVLLVVGVDYGTIRYRVPVCFGYTEQPRRGREISSDHDVQWGPAEVQPLVLSPKVWMWKARLVLGSLPLKFHVTLVGADSDSCSNVTLPLTWMVALGSGRRTATARRAVRQLEEIPMTRTQPAGVWKPANHSPDSGRAGAAASTRGGTSEDGEGDGRPSRLRVGAGSHENMLNQAHRHGTSTWMVAPMWVCPLDGWRGNSCK